MVNHMCEPIRPNRFASCGLNRALQGGSREPLTFQQQNSLVRHTRSPDAGGIIHEPARNGDREVVIRAKPVPAVDDGCPTDAAANSAGALTWMPRTVMGLYFWRSALSIERVIGRWRGPGPQ